MITIRRAEARGHAAYGWLDSHHTFSFGDYHDPEFMGFGPLRVINEDRVQPGKGFGTHGHRDMEIVSYVIEGELEHRDSLGNGSVIRPGDVQRMSAGTGVRHSEYNASPTDVVHFLQIWVLPKSTGLAPGYEQKRYSADERSGRWRLVGSPDGRDGSVVVHQDVAMYTTLLDAGATIERELDAGRLGWIQVVRGSLEALGEPLCAGDGAAIDGPMTLIVRATSNCEALFFDMARDS